MARTAWSGVRALKRACPNVGASNRRSMTMRLGGADGRELAQVGEHVARAGQPSISPSTDCQRSLALTTGTGEAGLAVVAVEFAEVGCGECRSRRSSPSRSG